MNGFTFLEVLVACMVAALVAALGAASLKSVAQGSDSVFACARKIEDFLAHANARGLAAQAESRISIEIGDGSLQPSWREEPLRLTARCSIRSAAFGVGGKSLPELVLYPSGTASPGNILIVNANADWCRITQSLRGKRTLRCFS